jgi:hypothetical protein
MKGASVVVRPDTTTPSPPIILPAIRIDELSDDFLGVYKGITLFSSAASAATLET